MALEELLQIAARMREIDLQLELRADLALTQERMRLRQRLVKLSMPCRGASPRCRGNIAHDRAGQFVAC